MVQADLALYGAKAEGRNCYRFHSRDLDQQVHERVTRRRGAPARAGAGRARALLPAAGRAHDRPHHRARGVGPLEPQDARLAAACRASSRSPNGPAWSCRSANGCWTKRAAGSSSGRPRASRPPVMAVNVSGVQVKGASELKRCVERSLSRWDLDPGQIELELTEFGAHGGDAEAQRYAGRAAAAGRRHRNRRFRHRLFVAQISHPLSGQPAEARAGIRVPRHGRLSQRRRGPRRHSAGATSSGSTSSPKAWRPRRRCGS